MKILLSSESYWPNKDGGAVFEHYLVHQLMAAGHEVRVLVPGKSWRHYNERDNGSYIYRTASIRLPLNRDYKVTYYARHQVLRALNDFKPDIVHIHTLALTGMSLLRHAKKQGIPVVATNHLMPENVLMSFPSYIMNASWVRKVFWKVLVKFHNKFIAVTTPTASAAQLLKDNGLTRPLTVVSNGVDTSFFRPLSSEPKNSANILKRFNLPKQYFIYLGRVNAEKRLDMLIHGFALAIKDCPDLHLVIAGTGNRSEELKDLANKLGIGEHVHFLGRVSDDEKRALYQHAEFFAITSPAELQSIVVLEAAACGLPIIAVDEVALRELCHDERNGYLLQMDDIPACVRAIEKLHSDKSTRQKFSNYSRDLIVRHHAQADTLKQYLTFYEFALKLHRDSHNAKKHLL